MHGSSHTIVPDPDCTHLVYCEHLFSSIVVRNASQIVSIKLHQDLYIKDYASEIRLGCNVPLYLPTVWDLKANG